MKLSVIVKTKEDFELILPLCEAIDKIQKEGKYLFYRITCLCNEESHNTFKKCIKKYKVNVPYSILEFDSPDLMMNQQDVLDQLREDIFRNPVDSVLMIGWDPINCEVTELLHEYKMRILLVDSVDTQESINGHYDYIFSTTDPDCWNNILETIIKIYKL